MGLRSRTRICQIDEVHGAQSALKQEQGCANYPQKGALQNHSTSQPTERRV